MKNTPVQLDALVVAAHPDDAEISVGGTILTLIGKGKRVGIVDLTRGEMGTRGDSDTRAAETAAADGIMRIDLRHNLDLPDGRVQVTVEGREALATLIRRHRPEILFAHHTADLHPDHIAAGQLAREAWYLAGLARLAEISAGQQAHRPRHLYHFMSHVSFDPPFVLDIGPVWERKLELVRCYASQITPEHTGDDGSHFLFGADILERIETKARYWGEKIGVKYGEPLSHVGPVPFNDPLFAQP